MATTDGLHGLPPLPQSLRCILKESSPRLADQQSGEQVTEDKPQNHVIVQSGDSTQNQTTNRKLKSAISVLRSEMVSFLVEKITFMS